MLLRVSKLIYGGDGLARLPPDEHGSGKSVFLPFVLEDEQVEAEITEEKPGFARGRLQQILQPSVARVAADCPYFGRCGGCHYQHATYEHQLELKAAILRETLQRTGKIELPCELQIHASPPWHYRNRSRFKIRNLPNFAVGYYGFRSHDFVAVDQCPISSPLINRALAAVAQLGASDSAFADLREIEFFADAADATLLVEAYCARGTTASEAQTIAGALLAGAPHAAGVTSFEEARDQNATPAKVLARAGQLNIDYRTNSFSYRVSAGSFFQVNRFLIDELISAVVNGLSGNMALDLYAGVGLFSLALARTFAQVIAVEASQTSFSDLRHNAPREVKAVRATTEQYLGQSSARADLVIVDPPRAGVGERSIRSLERMNPDQVVYVSCDPSTLARDLRNFSALGYKIEHAHLFDLFPQTFHIETVIRLAR